jgi:putative transposase
MVLRYIEGNPVRAKLVNTAKEWRWSSHRDNACKAGKELTGAIPIDIPADWGQFVDEPMTEKAIQKLRESVRRQSPYGEPKWQARVCEELGLESTLRQRGRPKKEEREAEK